MGKKRKRDRVRAKKRREERVGTVGNKGLFIGNFQAPIQGRQSGAFELASTMPNHRKSQTQIRHAG